MDLVKSKIVILASGRGSNFEAIAHAVQNGSLKHLEIAGLISNKSDAAVLTKARTLNIPSFLIEYKKFKRAGSFLKDEYENELLSLLVELSPNWICLAGYLLMLGPRIVRSFPNRIINIHPSLLPHFKGLHAQRQALEAGVTETGCTVHFVTEELDDGPIIVQKSILISDHETEESLKAKLLPLEHEAYIEALQKLSG